MRNPYQPKPTLTWWLKRRVYTLFILRELSAIFVAGYAILLLVLAIKVYRGPEEVEAYRDFLASPGMLTLHAISFVFALFHTITWLNLTPKAIVVRRGEERLSPLFVAVPGYIAALVLSALVALLFLL